ncbi:glycosyltransferase family 2 protein [Klebsiella michiganensis]|uniref:glycosyltransferase family 2 protein n=1 Tax=Klebsiella michiganensis TaxID=1134687 RepID=UPI0022482BA6|nr:glycosyl transferase [Klebsiella michiganensis]MCW9448034.1 glycosyl transferase [Klebsiella michiganensis]
MFKVIILIVLYNKKIEDSTTINSLLNSNTRNLSVIIHNNGPCNVTLTDSLESTFKRNNIDIHVVNCLDNKPLAFLYNDFVNDNTGFDYYCFFDDDTEVNFCYIRNIFDRERDIELPKIISKTDSLQYYPLLNDAVFTEDGTIAGNKIFSIGSGLLINRNVVNIFSKYNLSLFDEHFALYGVDFSFFRRLIFLKNKGERFVITSNSSLQHSLSKVEQKQSTFRRRERLIDFVLTVRHYPTTRLYLALIKRFIIEFSCLRVGDVILMIKTFTTGMHYKCKKWKRI